jgi:hypothetical protein
MVEEMSRTLYIHASLIPGTILWAKPGSSATLAEVTAKPVVHTGPARYYIMNMDRNVAGTDEKIGYIQRQQHIKQAMR